MMDGVKKNFGFGCMRLPMVNGEVDKDYLQKHKTLHIINSIKVVGRILLIGFNIRFYAYLSTQKG